MSRRWRSERLATMSSFIIVLLFAKITQGFITQKEELNLSISKQRNLSFATHSNDAPKRSNINVLFMSSLEQEENNSPDPSSPIEKLENHIRNTAAIISESLPLPPEDPLAIIGDIAAFGIYCFLDHFVNNLLENVVSSPQSLAETSSLVVDPDGTGALSQAINAMIGTDAGVTNTIGGIPGK